MRRTGSIQLWASLKARVSTTTNYARMRVVRNNIVRSPPVLGVLWLGFRTCTAPRAQEMQTTRIPIVAGGAQFDTGHCFIALAVAAGDTIALQTVPAEVSTRAHPT